MGTRNSSIESTSPIQMGIGGARRDRTADLLHAMQALSQLSYSPTEPGTLRPLAGHVKECANLGSSSKNQELEPGCSDPGRTLFDQTDRPVEPVEGPLAAHQPQRYIQ